MELALELGLTTETLAQVMLEEELVQWMRYAAKHMLPSRRMEAYLAQVCMVLVQVLGGDSNQVTLADFLIRTNEVTEEEEQQEVTVEEEIEFFDFKPRNKP